MHQLMLEDRVAALERRLGWVERENEVLLRENIRVTDILDELVRQARLGELVLASKEAEAIYRIEGRLDA